MQPPRNAIITGASRGIGQHIARALAAQPMNLLLVARSQAELGRLARDLDTAATKVTATVVDLGGPDAASQVADAAAAELGTVDVLVNNAATEPQTRFHVLTPAEIEHVLQVDLISPLLLSRLLLPGMLARGYGRIINISSLAGHTSFPHAEAYAAAKDGLTAFSRVLNSDYRGTGVAASSLILGPVKNTGVSARTLAETGLTASTAFSVTPEKVAAATLRAIDKPRARDRRQHRPRAAPQSTDGLLPRTRPCHQPPQRRGQAHGLRRRPSRSRPHRTGPPQPLPARISRARLRTPRQTCAAKTGIGHFPVQPGALLGASGPCGRKSRASEP